MEMDSLLTARQLQDLLRVDRITIYRMLKDGRIQGFKDGEIATQNAAPGDPPLYALDGSIPEGRTDEQAVDRQQ